ncbi:MAG: proline iminopeptidase-family hydrolase [Bacilli bacterium]
MIIEEGYIDFLEYKTYYRIAGADKKNTPLLILHGGPGSTHNSYELLDALADRDDRPIITYDQLGCGLSSIPDDKPELYCKEIWVKEIENLRKQLKLNTIHLMGHSWGGMLSIIYLCDYQPQGIKSVNLSSTLSSASLWDKETHRLISYLPISDQEAIAKAEKTDNYSSCEFAIANKDYLKMTVADLSSEKEISPCLKRKKNSGSVAYLTAWGPSEFRPLGNLCDYEYTDKLKSITCPVLLTSGGMDESTPLQNKTMYDSLTCAKDWHLFPNARHMTYFENNQEYIEVLSAFLKKND